jgi:hypothetical protein
MSEEKEKKLKPVVFSSSKRPGGAPDEAKQQMLLKAMQVTSDPKELKSMMGVRTVAEVYRTLDKLSIRREYHEALARNGISLDYIIMGFRKIIDGTAKESDKLAALKTLLTSIGMDKYDVADDSSGGSWEEALLKTLEDKGKNQESLESGEKVGESIEEDLEEYEVNPPAVPELVKKAQEEERRFNHDIYG